MSAKEMFEKLGYKQVNITIGTITNITYIKELGKLRRKDLRKMISFNKYIDELVDITIDEYISYKNKNSTHWQSTVNEKELEAINKQVLEIRLGGIKNE